MRAVIGCEERTNVTRMPDEITVMLISIQNPGQLLHYLLYVPVTWSVVVLCEPNVVSQLKFRLR